MNKNQKYGVFIFFLLFFPLLFFGYLIFKEIKTGGSGHNKKIAVQAKPMEIKKRPGFFEKETEKTDDNNNFGEESNIDLTGNEFYTTDKVVFNAKNDNSVFQVREYIRQRIYEPDSFFAMEWSRVLKLADGNFIVRCKYRYKEKKDYYLKNEVFTLDSAGNVINVESYGEFQKKLKE